MSSSQETVDFIVDQIENCGDVYARKMFGEYALYCGVKVVGLICDDQLFIKPTKEGEAFVGAVEKGAAYPGAKPSFIIPGDKWEDREWLSELIRITEGGLPLPKPKKKK